MPEHASFIARSACQHQSSLTLLVGSGGLDGHGHRGELVAERLQAGVERLAVDGGLHGGGGGGGQG